MVRTQERPWSHRFLLRRVKDANEIEAAKPVQEGLTAENVSALLSATEAQPGDLLLLAAGPLSTVNKYANAASSLVDLQCCCKTIEPESACLLICATPLYLPPLSTSHSLSWPVLHLLYLEATSAPKMVMW